jgi:uncharacterized protein YggL (DUF469 family)
MKKRIRKKLYLGEFRELGFEVGAQFRTGVDSAARDAFLERFVEAVAREGLAFGGGTSAAGLDGFVTLDHRGSTTEQHRERVQKLLAADEAVATPKVGPLVDAWHGQPE